MIGLSCHRQGRASGRSPVSLARVPTGRSGPPSRPPTSQPGFPCAPKDSRLAERMPVPPGCHKEPHQARTTDRTDPEHVTQDGRPPPPRQMLAEHERMVVRRLANPPGQVPVPPGPERRLGWVVLDHGPKIEQDAVSPRLHLEAGVHLEELPVTAEPVLEPAECGPAETHVPPRQVVDRRRRSQPPRQRLVAHIAVGFAVPGERPYWVRGARGELDAV